MKKSSKETERTKDYPIGVFHCSPTNSTQLILDTMHYKCNNKISLKQMRK